MPGPTGEEGLEGSISWRPQTRRSGRKKRPRPTLRPEAADRTRRLAPASRTPRPARERPYYLHDIIDEIDEAHYQRELKQFKKYSPDKDPDPEEEEYWRHETKHSIS